MMSSAHDVLRAKLDHLREGRALPWRGGRCALFGSAISQAGGARRPLTDCDSYPLAAMLLLARRSLSCAQLGFSALGARLDDDKYPIAPRPGMCTLITDDA